MSKPRLLTAFEERVLDIAVSLCLAVSEGKFNLRVPENTPGHRIMVAFLKRMKTAKQREQILLSCLANLPKLPVMAFWILEISTIVFIVYSFEYFLGGQMFPVDIMPAGIQAVMKWLPFYYELFFPITIFMERMRGAEMAQGLARFRPTGS